MSLPAEVSYRGMTMMICGRSLEFLPVLRSRKPVVQDVVFGHNAVARLSHGE